MRRLRVFSGVALGLFLGMGTAEAQERYRRPACELSRGHFLVNQAETYLRGGTEEKDPARREQLFGDARRTLYEAVDRGEVENPAVWYFLGRVFVETDDVAGVDTAFTRAVQLQPKCLDDVTYYRDMVWVPLINGAVDSLQAGAFDGAKGLLRIAMRLKPEDNVSSYYLARIFASEGDTDSAFYYLKAVASMPATDPTREENRVGAIQSVAQLHHSLQEWDSSIVWHRKLNDIKPGNPETVVALAEANQNVGNTRRANELYQQVLSNAGQFTGEQLFNAGRRLFVGEQYAIAAQMFEQGLTKNRFSRQGLFDLASSYRAIAQDESNSAANRRQAAAKMEAAALRLIEVDPQGSESLGLLAAAYQMQDKSAETDRVVQRMNRLTFDLEVFFAERSGTAYMVQGRFRNLRDTATAIPAVTFEFLDASGAVVGTDRAGGENLAARDALNFAVMAQGENIVAYRYKIAS